MIGQSIAGYTILEQLGKGGMGVVYKAHDTKLDRTVALKFLPAGVHIDEAVKERFVQEARAASALDDPHICTIHDFGETEDGRLFIVMAFYAGDTLKYRIEDAPLPVEDACTIARQMVLGLSAAHEAGIVHRDVKPANVMVTSKGRVKLLDFGVAKLEGGADLTREGTTIGTAAYMSPEQARGEAVDERSDIWAVGAVLYEMLSGRRPFDGPYDAAVAYSILNEEPRPLSGIPDDVGAVVRLALSKNPEERFSSATEMANALAEITGDSLVSAMSTGPVRSGSADAPSLQRVVLKFAVGAVIALAIVYAMMHSFGLPDWVFPAAAFLALIGFPIVLYGASLDRKRAKLDSSERRKLSGLKVWLTTRRAYQGGLMAGGGLIVMVVAFMLLRSAGVGRFATLISGGDLDRQDPVLVAEFENSTSHETLGSTVTEAFMIDLSQSSAIRMLERSQVISALQRMELNPDTMLTTDLAMQVAEREGVKAVVEGDIDEAGSGYILNARILSVPEGTQLAAFRENARSDAAILDAIDALSADLREEIGESLVDIRAGKPLERVTTDNMDALRLYSRAIELSGLGQHVDAVDLLERVVEMDSTFAMAYRKLAVLYVNINEPAYLVDETIAKGYRLRDRLPLRERLLTEALYYGYAADDEEKETRAYEEILRRYPYDVTALNNLALTYRSDGRDADAEKNYRRALEVGEGYIFRLNLVAAVGDQGDIERTEEENRKFLELYPDVAAPARNQARIEYLHDDFEAAAAWIDSMAARGEGVNDRIRELVVRHDLLIVQGRLAEARDMRRRSRTLHRDRRDWSRIEAETGRTRLLDSLRTEFILAAERANLTGENEPLLAAMRAYETARQDAEIISDTVHTNAGWYAFELSHVGEVEEARRWHEEHLAWHGRSGEPIERFERVTTGYVNARLGNVDAGLEDMQRGIDESGCDPCFRELMGDIEETRGNLEAAADHIMAYLDYTGFQKLHFDDGLVALYSFRLGYLHERLGNLDEAIRRYRYMADRWQDADPVLQPQVAEALRRVEQLLDQKAREPSS